MGKKNSLKSPIGWRLRQARTAKGISQKTLGILAGIDEFSASARVNQYERDKHVPDYSTAKRLAQALGISVTYLYAEDDEVAELIRLFDRGGKKARQACLELLSNAD
ncbi:MAG: helix-turn-helix transcriptional regulator [Candidatus Thiodiazotropha lotti]